MARNKNEEAPLRETLPDEWIENTINQAIANKASDIHIDPLQNEFMVRFRIEGILHIIEKLPLSYLGRVTRSLKVKAQLDVTEERRPQDGHIFLRPKGSLNPEPIDLRLSIFPTVFGEAVVMRIMNRRDLLFENIEK